MCRAKGYVFLAVLVCGYLVRIWFVYSSLELGLFLRRISCQFIIWR